MKPEMKPEHPPHIEQGDGSRMSALADAQAHLVLTSPPYFAPSLEAQLNAGLEPGADLDALEADTIAFAWGLRAVWAECTRVLATDARLVVQVRDVRLRERLVAVECVHRQMLGSLGWHLLARHAWRPVHATLGRRRMAAALAARSGPVPFDAEVFMVFARHGAALRGAPSAEDAALLSADTMVTPVGRLAQRHRFQAPLPVLAAFVRMATKPGDWVVDPFAGGGSTLKVANDLGRRAWGCDVDEAAVKQARVNLGLHAADGRGSRHEPDAGDDD
jgi:modification methylase